jgi:serine protease Do
MMHLKSAVCCVLWMAVTLSGSLRVGFGEETAPAATGGGVEQLAESARKSVVVVTVQGRDGRQQGLGSGFVVDPQGLIATNLHVIGEARPISVQTYDGKSYDVTAVHAFDRPLDLALIRIAADGLPALPLGNSDELKQGQAVVAIGNPRGLKHSVVTGVVSGTREIDGRQMIQLAIPIEQGNSGGPLLDLQGRVHGLLTMKSAVTDNLGFALPVNALKPLIEKPNPTPMARWLTIGALDPQEWKPLFGARWHQRAGRLLVDGLGQGFGGRSLCLWQEDLPEPPYEIAVSVKLDHEEGAAGLVFCADGGNLHYGFYPSNGRMRLSRFDGPDVFSWQVLDEVRNEHYRLGEWNTLKVRFEKGKISCFVNDQLAIESEDAVLSGGKVGLAKFRTTEAEFRRFRVAREIPPQTIPAEIAAKLTERIDKLATAEAVPESLAGEIAADGNVGVELLRQQARQMEQQAARLRKLAQKVHHIRVQNELAKLAEEEDEKIDLFRAALLIAWLDNEEVDVDAYCKSLDRMARDLNETLPKDADDAAKLAALNKLLFDELGFHGSRGDYYHRSNSYVNEVLDDREGLPITLAVIYMELAKRIGIRVVGVGLPGHFVVRFEPTGGERKTLDVYERAQELSDDEVAKIVRGAAGRSPQESDLAAATKRSILVRILHNLMGLSQRAQDAEGLLKYVDAIVAVAPDSGEERWMRAVLRARLGQRDGAMSDVTWLLENKPDGVRLNDVDELRRVLERE